VSESASENHRASYRKNLNQTNIVSNQKVLEIEPNSFATHYNLGGALFQKGQLDEAIAESQEVLRLKPDFSPAQDVLFKAQTLVQQREGNK